MLDGGLLLQAPDTTQTQKYLYPIFGSDGSLHGVKAKRTLSPRCYCTGGLLYGTVRTWQGHCWFMSVVENSFPIVIIRRPFRGYVRLVFDVSTVACVPPLPYTIIAGVLLVVAFVPLPAPTVYIDILLHYSSFRNAHGIACIPIPMLCFVNGGFGMLAAQAGHRESPIRTSRRKHSALPILWPATGCREAPCRRAVLSHVQLLLVSSCVVPAQFGCNILLWEIGNSLWLLKWTMCVCVCVCVRVCF